MYKIFAWNHSNPSRGVKETRLVASLPFKSVELETIGNIIGNREKTE
jgi:hypothetical protein